MVTWLGGPVMDSPTDFDNISGTGNYPFDDNVVDLYFKVHEWVVQVNTLINKNLDKLQNS